MWPEGLVKTFQKTIFGVPISFWTTNFWVNNFFDKTIFENCFEQNILIRAKPPFKWHYFLLFLFSSSVVYYSHRGSARIKKLIWQKLTGAPKNRGMKTFPDPVGWNQLNVLSFVTKPTKFLHMVFATCSPTVEFQHVELALTSPLQLPHLNLTGKGGREDNCSCCLWYSNCQSCSSSCFSVQYPGSSAPVLLAPPSSSELLLLLAPL